jgi:acyl-CoA thioesterase FadM
MVNFERKVFIQPQHLDAGGHANSIEQQKIAEAFQYECQEKLGFGMEALKSQGLFFVLVKTDVAYKKGLFNGDEITLRASVNITGHTQLLYTFQFLINGCLSTEIYRHMVLQTLPRRDQKPKMVRLPPSIIEAVGNDQKPHPG